MESFKILDSNKDIEKVMIINDKLTDFLARAENFYNSYLIKGNFSKESLELYILFLRYSMVYIYIFCLDFFYNINDNLCFFFFLTK